MSSRILELLAGKNEREKMIVRTSLIGILTNFFLAAAKAAIGLLANSIAFVLDAVNNLSDILSSVITIIGTRLAGRKADRNHPLGHGRIEYFAALLVAVVILYAGITAMIQSVKKIIHPSASEHSLLSLLVLGGAILAKLLLGRYVKKKGRQLHSDALYASGTDAFMDAVLSASVFLSTVLLMLSGINIEAYVGVLISAFIIKSGLEILWSTVQEMIGIRAPREIVEAVRSSMIQDKDVEGVFDIILHSYGPERYVGSAHVTVSDKMTARQIDEMERRLAEKVYKEQGILLTGIGIYISDSDPEIGELKRRVDQAISRFDGVLQTHGFSVDKEKKIIFFDIVLDFDLPDRQARFAEITQAVGQACPGYEIRPVLDLDV